LVRTPARGSTPALKSHSAFERGKCVTQLVAHHPIGFYRHNKKKQEKTERERAREKEKELMRKRQRSRRRLQ
jgi:hypothetical protein